jgi:predicted metal-dependent hydrolase
MTLRARKVRFGWGDVPRDWLPADLDTQLVIDAIHLLLPAGERWFCAVLSQVTDRISDPVLRAQLDGFIRQEGWHARSHADVLDHFARHGIRIDECTREVEWLFGKLGADRPFGMRLPEARWLELRVATIAAIEHLTCVLGTWILDARVLEAAGAHPTMLDLLRWHGAEEVEHRAVAFDVATALGIGWTRRVIGYAIVMPIFTFVWVRAVQHLADQHREARPTWGTFLRGGKRGILPSVGYLARASLRYLRPWYDPRREASDDDAQTYLARSPAVAEVA